MMSVKSKRDIVRQKPACVQEYNENMKGVDQMDQNISYYEATRRSLKWTKKVFQWYVQLGVFQTYLLHKFDDPTSNLKHRDLLNAAIKLWLDPKKKDMRTERPSSPEAASEEANRHRLKTIEKKSNGKTMYPQQKCLKCRRRTRYMCTAPSCASALCRDCFWCWKHDRDPAVV